jgi:sulfur-carrier protein
MSTIRVPPALRSTVGKREVRADGQTVREVLTTFVGDYPPVRDQIFDENDNLRRFVNVYLNEQDIQYLDSLNTPAGADDTIIILPAMAGGAIVQSSEFRVQRSTFDDQGSGFEAQRLPFAVEEPFHRDLAPSRRGQ